MHESVQSFDRFKRKQLFIYIHTIMWSLIWSGALHNMVNLPSSLKSQMTWQFAAYSLQYRWKLIKCKCMFLQTYMCNRFFFKRTFFETLLMQYIYFSVHCNYEFTSIVWLSRIPVSLWTQISPPLKRCKIIFRLKFTLCYIF